MGVVEIICTTIAGLITLVAVALAARAVTRMLSVVRLGQPDPTRLGSWGARTKVMLKETAGHTRMLKWSAVGALSRFTGSTMWQGYFVEWVIVGVLVCGFLIRGFKAATDHLEFPTWAAPLSHGLGSILPAWESGAPVVAAVKIVISMTWLIVISL